MAADINTIPKRFWSKVDKKGPNDCWEWKGQKFRTGYGRLDNLRAHRISYILSKGKIPDGLIIMHQCDNKSCVNPNHLDAGTYSQNTKDAYDRGLSKAPHGAQHGKCRISDDMVRAIRESTLTHRQIMAKFGVSKSTVYYIRKGTRRYHVKDTPEDAA